MAARRNAERPAEPQRPTRAGLREAGRRKDELIAMLAHALRDPLAPIANAARLPKSAAHDPAPADSTGG